MMIRGNWLGFAMFAAGGIVAAIGGLVLRAGDTKTMIGVGAALFVLDATFRLWHREGPNWVFSKTGGGYFFFVPVWLLGLLVIILNALIGAGVLKK